MTEGRGQGSHRRINYIYKKKKKNSLCFSFCINLHQANIKANPTHEHGNIQQEVTSSRFIWRTTTARRFDYRPHCRKTPGWCESVELKLFRSALSHCWIHICVTVRDWWKPASKQKNHRAADSPPGVCVEAQVVRFGEKKVTNIDSVFLDWWDLKKHICIFFYKKKIPSYITIFRH